MENIDEPTVAADWMTKEFFEKVTTADEKAQCAVTDFAVEPGTSKGENYGSSIFRATVNYTVEAISKKKMYIIKAASDDETLAGMMDEMNTHRKEIRVYHPIQSECHKLLRSFGDDTVFGPKFVYSNDKVLVLEDLSVKGYKIKGMQRALDLEECKMTLAKVAKFHATNAYLHTKHPEYFNLHLIGNFGEAETPMHTVFRNGLASTIRQCKKIDSLKEYVDKLEAFEKVMIQRLTEIFTRDESSQFNVLTHGDLWSNNLLFKTDELGKSVDILLIDYQEGFYGSVGIDLNYFVYTSCNPHVFTNHLDEMLEFYHSVLVETLNKIGYSETIPSQSFIKEEFYKKGDHGLITATSLLPIMMAEKKEYADGTIYFEDSEQNIAIRDIVFSSKKYINFLEEILPMFFQSGHL